MPTVAVMTATTSRIALVTGATQGLGFALVQGLAQRLGPADLVLLTSRDPDRVAQAAAQTATRAGRTATVQGRALDVTDANAVARFAREIEAQYGGLDLAFSNATARMSPDVEPAEQVDLQLDTSNVATSRLLRTLLPQLRSGGTFLVVSSALGTLAQLPERVRPRFAEATTLDEVDAVVEEYRGEVQAGTAEKNGWPRWLNIASKVGQVAAVRAVARDRRERDLSQGTLLASVCPGLIDTGASRPWFPDMSTAQTPEQAAVAVLDLALSRPVDPATYGELVQFGKVLPWTGQVETGHRTEA
jgi:NAD(P)-dependent dehydrogenase (short-subunit alcohol dehydrogenase family)